MELALAAFTALLSANMFVLAEKRKHFAPLRKMRSTEF
jgi:hypothetical protein